MEVRIQLATAVCPQMIINRAFLRDSVQKEEHLEDVGLILVLDDVHGVGAHVHDRLLHLWVAESHRQLRVCHYLLQHLQNKAGQGIAHTGTYPIWIDFNKKFQVRWYRIVLCCVKN